MKSEKTLFSGARIVAGFTLAPTIGALAIYLLLNMPLLLGYELPGLRLPTSSSFIMGGILTAGSIFYPAAVLCGFAVMMFIHRFQLWNLGNCVLGGVISAVLMTVLIAMVLVISGTDLNIAAGISAMILGLMVIPSVMAGLWFWLLTVYKNRGLEHFFASGKSDGMQQAVAMSPAGACAINSIYTDAHENDSHNCIS